MMAVVVALLVHQTEARFVLHVSDVPVSELTVAERQGTWVYRSVALLEDVAPFERVLELRAGEPEVRALLRPPKLGCQTVIEERTNRPEPLCAIERTTSVVRGTIDTTPFVARYGPHGLEEISVAGARWTRSFVTPLRPLHNPFANGVPLGAGPLGLRPPLKGVRATQHVRGVGSPDEPGRLRCLEAAKQLLTQRPHARLALGVVLDDDRAYPHAWLVEDGRDLDPTVPADQANHRAYLELPPANVGALYLELFSGQRTVTAPHRRSVRVPSAP